MTKVLFIIIITGESKEERRKRKKSRWGSDEKDKSFILGMPTVLPTNLSKEQEAAYLCEYTELYEKYFYCYFRSVNNTGKIIKMCN